MIEDPALCQLPAPLPAKKKGRFTQKRNRFYLDDWETLERDRS